MEIMTCEPFDFGGGTRWQAQDEDGRYYDVSPSKEDGARLGKLYDATWKNHWSKAREKLGRLPQLGTARTPDDTRAAYGLVFGEVDQGEGNLAGDVRSAVYWGTHGVDWLGGAYFSGRGGDSPSRESFELMLDDQIRERLSASAQDELAQIDGELPRSLVEMWIKDLQDSCWD